MDYAQTTSSYYIVATLVICIILYKIIQIRKSKQYHLPPKIPGYPLIGNVFDIDPARPHISFTHLGEKYGDIFRINVLNEDIIVVNGIDLIRDALITKSQDFAGRPKIFRIDYGFHHQKDVIFGDYSPKWCYLKKLAASSLRMFGSNAKHVEEVVKEEMEALVHAIELQRGEPFDPRVMLMTAVVNALSASMIGKRYDHDDCRMAQYKLTTRLFSESCSPTKGLELDVFPWLRFFNNTNFAKLTHARTMLSTLVDEELAEAKERFDPTNASCILDLWYKELECSYQQKTNGKNGRNWGIEYKSSQPLLGEADIRTLFIDLLVSGTFTTAVALSTFVLLMMNHPNIEQELREEVARKLGSERLPTVQDMQNLPIIESFILELLRYLSHVPLSLPHFTTTDTTLGGYDIKKNTKVLLNFWSTHHDPNIWKEPWNFDHKRFLSHDGSLLPSTHAYRKCMVAFGGGKRMCLGETIARERLFLFITSLLQNFKFVPPEGDSALSPDPRNFDLGLILEPKYFQTCALPEKCAKHL